MQPALQVRRDVPHGAVGLGPKAQLEARGVRFVADFDGGHCLQAIFVDPDGNALELHHRYQPKR